MPPGRWFSVPLPLRADPAAVETVQQLQKITCVARASAEVRGHSLFAHFELASDAIEFLETWIALVAPPVPRSPRRAPARHRQESRNDMPSAPIRLVPGLSAETRERGTL